MLNDRTAHWQGLFTGYLQEMKSVSMTNMDSLEQTLTLEQADAWCYANLGAVSYVNARAAMDALDEELWGDDPTRVEFDVAISRLHNWEEFYR